MAYSIFLYKKAKTEYDSLDKKIKERIKEKIAQLKTHPNRGIHLKHSIYWKLRVGDYRIIYEINNSNKQIIILLIVHRKNVYDKFSKLF